MARLVPARPGREGCILPQETAYPGDILQLTRPRFRQILVEGHPLPAGKPIRLTPEKWDARGN